jgi:hypothetical protein
MTRNVSSVGQYRRNGLTRASRLEKRRNAGLGHLSKTVAVPKPKGVAQTSRQSKSKVLTRADQTRGCGD